MITFQDKVSINTDPSIADINKIKDSDINALKAGINTNETSINNIKNKMAYSTTEVQTNKVWIDGKPIYRKVISIPSFSNTAITVSTGITNIKEIINLQGSYSRNGYNRRYSIDNIYMDEWFINFNDGTISVKTNNQYVQYEGYIIIEYTKTTDVAL